MILAAGLTPAWQQILRFERFAVGEVNRASEARWCASGKVLNVGIALDYLGADCKTLSMVGGDGGASIRREFSEQGIRARWIESAAATRVCTTILDNATGMTTELVENAAAPTADELSSFRDAFREEAQSAGIVVLSGSLPAGTPEGFYRDLLQQTAARSLLDIRGPELLQALECGPFLVKPNREELAKTVGVSIDTDEQLVAAMRQLNERGAAWVVITHGPQAVWATAGSECYRFVPPKCEAVNPIGCGDCLAAGIAWALENGEEPVTAIQTGIAAAGDNLGQLLPARLQPERVCELSQQVQVDAV